MKMNHLVITVIGALIVSPALQAKGEVRDRHDSGYTADRFNRADANKDGFLSLEEAASVAKKFEGINGQKRFNKADTDGDGLLSLKEASARKTKENEHGGKRAKKAQDSRYNKSRFDEADTDKDGYLSREEANASKQATEILGGKRFDHADNDGDGKLSLKEAADQKKSERKLY